MVAEILVSRLYLQYIPNSVRTQFCHGLGLGHDIEFKYFDKNGYFFVSKGTSSFGTFKMSLSGLCFAIFQAVKGTGSRDIIILFLPNLDSSRFSYLPLLVFSIFRIFFLFMYDIQHCFICRPSDSTMSEDAGKDGSLRR